MEIWDEIDQKKLQERANNPGSYEDTYPIWKCPKCGRLERFTNGLGESCVNCKEDHTLDWDKYIISNKED